MRHTLGRALGVFLVVGIACCAAAAEETKSSWWPWGGGDKGDAAASSAASSSKEKEKTAAKERPWLIQSPSTKVSWPEFHTPQALSSPHLPHLWPNKTTTGTSKNTWAEKQAAASHSSPLQTAKNGAHRVADGTKSTWHKTVNALTPGDGKTEEHPRMAHRDPKPSAWQRWFGTEEQKPEGPRTVTEWMAQDRLDP